MVAERYDYLRKQKLPVDVEDLDELRADIQELGAIVAELADHAFWTETYGNDNAENKADLRSLKDRAQNIRLGLVR